MLMYACLTVRLYKPCRSNVFFKELLIPNVDFIPWRLQSYTFGPDFYNPKMSKKPLYIIYKKNKFAVSQIRQIAAILWKKNEYGFSN